MTRNIAHRGFSSLFPENTMPAFEGAIKAGCDGIELDVHLSADGQVVIIHDETLERTTDGKGFVKDKTACHLRALDAGNGASIPLLDDYFDLVANRDIISNIELKNGIFRYEGMEELVVAKIRDRGLSERVILSSFNHYSILLCKRIAPEIRCGFLTAGWMIDAGAYAKRHGVEFLHPEYQALTDTATIEIHSHGIAINTYTVNDADEMVRLASLNVAGIITDNPALLKEVLAKL